MYVARRPTTYTPALSTPAIKQDGLASQTMDTLTML